MINTRAGAVGVGLAVLLALAGLVLTGLLLDYHIQLATGGTPVLRSVCDRPGTHFECENTLSGAWGQFRLWKGSENATPTALLGFIYFAAVSAWFLVIGRPSGSRYSWHWFAVLMTAVGAGFAGYLGWAMYKMYRETSALCLPCIVVEAIAGLLFIVTLLIWPRRRQLVVLAEPVAGPVRGPMNVRIPEPDYPPGRALLAWVLMTVGIAALGWLAYEGLLSRHAEAQMLANLRGSQEKLDATARQREQDAQVAQAEAAALRASTERLTTDAQAAQTKALTADQQRAALAADLEKARAAAEKSATDAKAAQTKAETAEQQRATLATELDQTRAAVAELQKSVQETTARLKDYEDDYQAVWFNFINEPIVDIPLNQDDSIRGKVDAPHTVVLFMDLQCPYCQGATKIIQQKIAKYPDKLRLVVKHFPLDKDCNESVTGTTHAAACPAAVTVEAARAVGGEDAFWKMYDELFARQAEFAKKPKEFVKEVCGRIGIDNDELWKKINTTSVWDRITKQAKEGGALGLQATPAVYYDGRKVAGWANSKFWDFIMWQEQRQGGTPSASAATQPAASTQP